MHVTLQNLLEVVAKERDFFKLASVIKVLRDDWEYPLSKISKIINKHPSYVSSLIRVNNLPEIVKDSFYSKQITESHLLVLSRLNDRDDISEAFKEILKNSLSLSQTQVLIRKYLYSVDEDGEPPDVDSLYKMEKMLQDKLSAKVKINQSRVTGKITIERKGPVKVATLHRCFPLAPRPRPRLPNWITPLPHPSSLPPN